ncbi:MAG TPA: hypothetical protein V6D03_03545, partial [Candidatus Caenarcaniphilales bacterium]
MKRIRTIAGLIGLFAVFSFSGSQLSHADAQAAPCPKPAAFLPALNSAQDQDFYERFDFHVRDIVADADTIRFQTPRYDFVFCRGDRSWTVQPGSLPSNALQSKQAREAYLAKLANPPYEKIHFQGKPYQYRVLLEPNPFPNFKVEATKVILQLKVPNAKPKTQTLYTLKELLQAAAKKLGQSQVSGSLGVPRITAAQVYGNRLWWSLAFEQGEGNNGLTTLVGYHPQQDQWTVIHPQGVENQQVLDLAITGDPTQPTFWLGTQISGEGNPYLPG